MSAEARVKRVVTVQDAQEILWRYGYGHHADALDALIPEPSTAVLATDEEMALYGQAEAARVPAPPATVNYCPEHGDLLTLWGGRDTRSLRCQEAHSMDEIRALIPGPPTDDEREALDFVIRDALAPLHIDYTPWHRIVTVLLDAILASPPWRNRRHGPITEAVERAVSATWAPSEYLNREQNDELRSAYAADVRRVLEAAGFTS